MGFFPILSHGLGAAFAAVPPHRGRRHPRWGAAAARPGDERRRAEAVPWFFQKKVVWSVHRADRKWQADGFNGLTPLEKDCFLAVSFGFPVWGCYCSFVVFGFSVVCGFFVFQKIWIRDATLNVQQVLYIQAITKQSKGKEMPTTEHVSLFSYEGRCCPFPPNVLPPALT